MIMTLDHHYATGNSYSTLKIQLSLTVESQSLSKNQNPLNTLITNQLNFKPTNQLRSLTLVGGSTCYLNRYFEI